MSTDKMKANFSNDRFELKTLFFFTSFIGLKPPYNIDFKLRKGQIECWYQVIYLHRRIDTLFIDKEYQIQLYTKILIL